MSPATAPNPLPREASFGYTCRRCANCCRDKDIPVNPYEVARLARRLGQTTTEFCAAWTQEGAGAVLLHTETRACVFLGGDGCTVHADRPLACRLYPLGLQLLESGVEQFVRLEPHPESSGAYTRTGTIASFLEANGVAPFLQATGEYFRWVCAARKHRGAAPRQWLDWREDTAFAGDLVDMDVAVTRYCAATGEPEPTDIEERKRLHLTMLNELINDSAKGGKS